MFFGVNDARYTRGSSTVVVVAMRSANIGSSAFDFFRGTVVAVEGMWRRVFWDRFGARSFCGFHSSRDNRVIVGTGTRARRRHPRTSPPDIVFCDFTLILYLYCAKRHIIYKIPSVRVLASNHPTKY